MINFIKRHKKLTAILTVIIILVIIYSYLVHMYIAPNPFKVIDYYLAPKQEQECGPDAPYWCEQNNSFECKVKGFCID